MIEIKIDVARFAADPDAAIVVSMMMVLNDIERLADVRDVRAAHPRNHQYYTGFYWV
jgi:hypothetical protein